MCTRVLWNSNPVAVLVGRSMDWPESTDPLLVLFPSGRHRDGGMLGPQRVVSDNPLSWTSRYASLATTVYGVGTADGFNEKGLGAHLLYLTETRLPDRDPTVPGLCISLWAQYLLDMAATVEEAIDLLREVQLVMVAYGQFTASVHLAIEDASGDSAIIEHLNGEQVIHRGRDYRIMTNDPPYDQQLSLLAGLDLTPASSDVPLPGNVSATDRFQRAAYWESLLPEPADERSAVASVMAIMRNVSIPFGAPHGSGGVFDTEYRTVSDLTHRRYFFELSNTPSVLWVELDAIATGTGVDPLVLDPDDIELAGDVSGRFQSRPIAF